MYLIFLLLVLMLFFFLNYFDNALLFINTDTKGIKYFGV